MKRQSIAEGAEPCGRRAGAAIAVFVAGLFAATAGHAEEGPFAGLDGAWSGTGTISLSDGTKERMRCRNQYVVMEEGRNLQQALRCSSDSYEFHVNTYVDADARGALSGNWTEVTRNVSGRVTGKADRAKIEVNVAQVADFSAKMSITTTGNRQAVVIEPKGVDVTLVSVTLNKLP